MAAGLGTRLRPLTYGLPKPMVPVANRPVMEHILRLLPRHGFERAIANLHWFTHEGTYGKVFTLVDVENSVLAH